MKKILALLLAICMLLGLAACGKDKPTDANSSTDSSAASDVDDNSSSAVSSEIEKVALAKEIYAAKRTYSGAAKHSKRNLNNTAYKLKNKKELKVLYFGGSITAGQGSGSGRGWSYFTTDWLESQYPNAKITEVNTAVGGQGAYLGLFRSDRDVIAHKPDLVFIEFAMNDLYQGFSKEQSTVLAESLIRKINKELPETDIVIVLTTDKSRLQLNFANAQAYKEVGDYYGIPVINVGYALKKELDKGEKTWDYYAGDIVHPTDAGHQLYADTVTAELKNLLPSSPKAPTSHKLSKTTYISNIIENTQTLQADEIGANSDWNNRKSRGWVESITKFPKQLAPKNKGAEITIVFEGTTFGLLAEIKRDSTVSLTIDDKETVMLKEKDATNEVERYVFDNLAKGKHKVKIKYAGPAYFAIGAICIG